MNIDTRNQDNRAQEQRTYGYAIAFAAGTAIGAGLALWLAPRAAEELRHRVTDTASRFGQRATEHYHDARQAVGETVSDLGRQVQSVRTEAAEAVARGAREVERVAVAVKSDRI